MSPKDQVAYLKKGAEHLIEEAELLKKIERGKPLTIKVGFDPSAPDIHLGHTVVMRKMRHFQELGHRVIFLIGDFTGLIGDPSGKKTTRPQLSREEVLENAETYKKQAFKILDPEKTVIDFNSRWLGELGSEGWIRLAGKVTLARIMERDDFTKRWQANEPIFLHELLYPLAQGYDSVALKADVELGGTDQLFNLLVGRNLMREYTLEPQVVLTLPLLEGLDGVEKMSKSLNNYVAVEDPSGEMFGKLMSVSDTMMWKYYTLLTDFSPAEIEGFKKDVEEGRRHPKDAKVALAKSIVADFHSREAADEAHAEFERIFREGQVPTDMPEHTLPASEPRMVVHLLKDLDLCPSNAESRRMIAQGAVSINGEKVSDEGLTLEPKPGDILTLKVGKRRWARVTFN
ncbi:MAG TPA: tyrosine--tRNA ligase [Thermoanaerobaculia bacterium]|nr:tyrosine--tRNA ligase [Thermoanaerobaculia bacterium]HUM30627.1 tyrosine--tRNA ligase [Thermoanaerobaculia bacterium]HXK68845.1 tyrosine--tRNA ligase [Thermoanaerobaculia bacterium]